MNENEAHWSYLFATIRKTVFLPINPAGWPFITIFAVVSVLLALMSSYLGILGLLLTLWCIFFFRDPLRTTPDREGLVISPACGTVVAVTPDVTLPPELDQAIDSGPNFTRISVFLSVFDVHVNRNPYPGTVKQIAYRPGKFLNAALDKASTDNEMSATLLRIQNGKDEADLAYVQIAGWVARRIINQLTVGQTVRAGQHMGLIRFGSRIDVYVPDGCVPMVIPGQKTIEGETVLADFKSKEKPRSGGVVM